MVAAQWFAPSADDDPTCSHCSRVVWLHICFEALLQVAGFGRATLSVNSPVNHQYAIFSR
jgi:hypothetical protein